MGFTNDMFKDLVVKVESLNEREKPMIENMKKREVEYQLHNTELMQLKSLLEKEIDLATFNQDAFRAYK